MTTVRDQTIIKQAKRRQPYCSRCMTEKGLHGHHIICLQDGGADVLDNICVLCDRCHKEWHRFYDGLCDHAEFVGTPPMTIFAMMACKEENEDMTLSDIRSYWMHYQLMRLRELGATA